MIGDGAFNAPKNKYPQYTQSSFLPVSFHSTLADPSWVCSYTKNHKKNASDPNGGSLVNTLVNLVSTQAMPF